MPIKSATPVLTRRRNAGDGRSVFVHGHLSGEHSMSKELDRLKHLVVKMQVRYGEGEPDVQRLVEDVNALELHEARERRASQAQALPRQWGNDVNSGDGAGTLTS